MERTNILIPTQKLREEIANTTLVVATIFGTLVYFSTATIRFFSTGFNPSQIFETATILAIWIATAKRKKILITIKAWIIIFLLLFLSISDVLVYGLLASAKIYLVLIPIFTILFFSFRKGVFFFLVSITLYIVIGYLHTKGYLLIPETYAPEKTVLRMYSWVVNAIHMGLVALIMFYIIYRFIETFTNLISGLDDRNTQLEQQERNYREIFNSTNEAIFIHDATDGKIIDFNNAVLNLYGYKSRSEIKDLKVEDISAIGIISLPGTLKDLIKKAVIEGPQVFEWISRKKNREIFHSEVSLKKAFIDGKERVLAVVRNIDERKRAEKEIIKARETAEIINAKLTSVLENTTEKIWAIDTNYNIIYTNKVFQDEYFSNFGVLLNPGVNALDSLPEILRPLWKSRFDYILEGKNMTFEDNLPTATGRVFVQVNMHPIISEGKIIGVSCFGRNITEQKLAEEAIRQSEEKFRIIFEKSPLGILKFDKNGIINDCNHTWVEIIGSSKEKILGVNLLTHPDERFRQCVIDVLDGQNPYFEGDYQSITANKTTPVRFFFAPDISRDGTPEGGICIAEDRTQNQQKELYKKQVEVARESVKFKQNFLANMSHEIRTPLTGVLGMLEILEKTQLSKIQQEYINTLKLSGENLKEIINQVLDYSKIEAGKVILKPSPFEFKSLINGAEILYQNIARPGVKFCSHIDEKIPQTIIGDWSRLSQIINNLVSNALKFTEKGSVVINVKQISCNETDGTIIIKVDVKDTGIGIPDGLKENLFTPFGQIDDNDKRYKEGTGLGLTICKELVTLHGGEIGVVSEYKKGSTFWFTFAAKMVTEEHLAKKTSTQTPRNESLKLKILYAEDKKINQAVVNILLSSLGHTVTLANNGREALEIYNPGKFDLILMDIQMPEMDGITATQYLKKRFADLPPIIGLSANAFEGDREKYMAQGMDDYLTKPVKTDDFKALMARLFP